MNNYSNLRPKLPVERAVSGARKFVVERPCDVTGVSGTGVVIEGIAFATGQTIIHWLTPAPKGSLSIFEGFDDFVLIHIKPHPENKTRIVFEDGEIITFDQEV